jgi:hypothetical protein
LFLKLLCLCQNADLRHTYFILSKTPVLPNMPLPTNARVRYVQSSPGEEVVISGLAGYFPESENVYQLRDNLFNEVDMVTEDDRRWKFGQYFS